MQDLLLILILLLVLLTLISLLGGSIYQDKSYLSAVERYFQEEQFRFRPWEYLKGMMTGHDDNNNNASMGLPSGLSSEGLTSGLPSVPAGSGPLPSETYYMGATTTSAATNAASYNISSGPSADMMMPPPSKECCRECGNTSCKGCKKSSSSGRVWWTAESIEETEPYGSSIGFASTATGGAKQRREKGSYAKF